MSDRYMVFVKTVMYPLVLRFCIVASMLLCGVQMMAQNKGYLVIIGGGPRPETIMKKILALAGGNKAKIVVIPMASSEPAETAKAQKEQLEKLGAPAVDVVICTAANADIPANLEKIRKATGIFFSGGDQSRLKKALWNTALLKEIHALYKRGGVISGTSAGAAVQSKIMLTGDEAVNKDSANPYGSIQQKNIVTDEGFGFLDKVIIDQHFLKRKRHNRLITLVLEHPEQVGVGIDESTCIIARPDQTFEVMGETSAIIFDASKAKNIRANANKHLSASGIQVHIIPDGGIYNYKTKTVVK